MISPNQKAAEEYGEDPVTQEDERSAELAEGTHAPDRLDGAEADPPDDEFEDDDEEDDDSDEEEEEEPET